MRNLISTSALSSIIGRTDVVVLDASWHLPTAQRDAKAEFVATRIPGARFFDIDAISEIETNLPHMLPSSKKFSMMVGLLGVSNQSHVVCYDSVGLISAARCWWMFKVFGHKKVSVLDGGLKKWLAEGRATESGAPVKPPQQVFESRLHTEMVADIETVAAQTGNVIDARSPTRFRGEEPEPRPGVMPGHMPGASNLHYAKLLNPDGSMKSAAEFKSFFADAGVDLEKPVITSCGSGVTAAILTLALTELGKSDHKLYDGSWAEWGASGREIVTG